MRRIMLVGFVAALGACNPTATNTATDTAVADTSTASTAGLPSGFPATDLAARGAECVVYLGMSRAANATPAGRDAPIMEQAANQWQASMRIDGHLSETEVQQLIGSTTQPLALALPAERDAASAWCVENAPEPDPH